MDADERGQLAETIEGACNAGATQAEREWLLVLGILVANKPARRMVPLTEQLVGKFGDSFPFSMLSYIETHGGIEARLRELRAGQYKRIGSALRHLAVARLDLGKCSLEDLEYVPGIGPKTARWFLLRTQPGARFAALDTHILKWLHGRGYDVPRHTPTGKRYAEIEKCFLEQADKLGMTPAALDLLIWEQYAKG